jgi:hypothetical protein
MRNVVWWLEDPSTRINVTRRLLQMMMRDVNARTRLEAFTTLCGSHIQDPLSLLKECLEHEDQQTDCTMWLMLLRVITVLCQRLHSFQMYAAITLHTRATPSALAS